MTTQIPLPYRLQSLSPPSSNSALIPPGFTLCPFISQLSSFPESLDPISNLPLARLALSIQKALLEHSTILLLLLNCLHQPLIQRRRRERRQRRIHPALSLAPRAFEMVQLQQLSLGRSPQLTQLLLERQDMACQLLVGLQSWKQDTRLRSLGRRECRGGCGEGAKDF
jgi:hypothetical protein